MKIINRPILSEFLKNNSEVKEYLTVWLLKVQKANWTSKRDVINTFPKTEFSEWGKTCFPIFHSPYFIYVDICYSAKILSIQFIDFKTPEILMTALPSLKETKRVY